MALNMYISQKIVSINWLTIINININSSSSKNVPIERRVSLLTLIRFCGATSWCLLTSISFNKEGSRQQHIHSVMINATSLSLQSRVLRIVQKSQQKDIFLPFYFSTTKLMNDNSFLLLFFCFKGKKIKQ